MGIYTNGAICGIRMYNFNDDDFANILFEDKSDEIMSRERMREAFLFYTGLNNGLNNELNNKNEIYFQYYTECSSTYGEGTYFNWCQLPLNVFLEKFGI